jgi:hypothetical protein
LETHAEITKRPRRHAVEARSLERPHPLRAIQWLEVGCVAGVLGGIALALPLILWDWVHAGHRALELPMATTAWLFGLDHFSHSTYFIGSIVVGFVLLGVYWAVSGLVFTGLADRLLGIATIGKSLAAGAAWSFVSFILLLEHAAPDCARRRPPPRGVSRARAVRRPGLGLDRGLHGVRACDRSGVRLDAIRAAANRRGRADRDRITRAEGGPWWSPDVREPIG